MHSQGTQVIVINRKRQLLPKSLQKNKSLKTPCLKLFKTNFRFWLQNCQINKFLLFKAIKFEIDFNSNHSEKVDYDLGIWK